MSIGSVRASRFRRSARRAAGLALLVALSLPALATAHGGGGALELDVSTVPAGGTVEVRGSGLAHGEEVVIQIGPPEDRRTLADATGDHDGEFAVPVEVPADLPPGSYEIRAAGIDGGEFTAPLEVLPAADASDEPEATTGSQVDLVPSPTASDFAGPTASGSAEPRPAATPAASAVAAAAPRVEEADSQPAAAFPVLPLIVFLAGLGAVVFGFVRRRRIQ